MPVIQSCLLCPLSSVDSFQGSLFQGFTMPLLRYNFGSRNYCSTQSFIWSRSVNEQDHPRNLRFLIRKEKYQGSQLDRIDGNFSEASISKSDIMDGNSSIAWLDKWKETRQRLPRRAPRQALNYRSRKNVLSSFNSSGDSSRSHAGGSTMDRIVEKLKYFGYMDDANEDDDDREKGSVKDIIYVEEGILPNTRRGFSEDSSLGLERIFGGEDEALFPWEQPAAKAEEAENSVKRRSRTYIAELTLPESELMRLKHLTLKTKQKVKIGGSGVTQTVVDTIHQKWKSSEIVRLKVEGAPALNMKRVHEILEVCI